MLKKVRISDLRPADYNPRKLSDEAFSDLKESIRTLGQIKPILVRSDNNIIIAGHQRTLTMKALGMEYCDAFVLEGLNTQDECRFNQMHNKCEYEISEDAPRVRITSKLEKGLNTVHPQDVVILDRGQLASVNQNLSTLIMKYGEFCFPIASEDGDVKISSAYAYCCKCIGIDFRVLVLSDEDIKTAVHYFSKTYGEFDYDGIKRYTYKQSLAQMNRLRKSEKKVLHSRTYEQQIIPYLKTLPNEGRDLRIIDFGAGHYDYANALNAQGYSIIPIDPYHRISNGKNAGNIDYRENREQFLKICRRIKFFGLFDIVICDSVLNSIDTMQAYTDVVNTCWALCRRGGQIFISGRPLVAQTINRCKRKCAGKTRTNYFLDRDGLTAQFREGVWFFQKFDTREQVMEWARRIGKVMDTRSDSNGYRLHIRKDNEIDRQDAIESLRREWDLPLPDEKRYGLGDHIEEAYLAAISRE